MGIHIQYQNSAISDSGLIFNWNTIIKWDENNEYLVNFEIPYSVNCPVNVKIEPEDKCIIYDFCSKGFKVKRKNKRVKEAKWFAVGY